MLNTLSFLEIVRISTYRLQRHWGDSQNKQQSSCFQKVYKQQQTQFQRRTAKEYPQRYEISDSPHGKAKTSIQKSELRLLCQILSRTYFEKIHGIKTLQKRLS